MGSLARTLRITVPWVLRHKKRRRDGKLVPVRTQPSANEWRRWHWGQRKHHVDRVYALVGDLVASEGWQPPAMHRARVTYTVFFPRGGRHDPDNLSPKFLSDSLVAAGVVEDDDFEHMEPRVVSGGVDREAPRIEVLVEEVAD